MVEVEVMNKTQAVSQLSVAIPKELHTALKIDAARRDVPLKDVVIEALEVHLGRKKKDAREAAA